MTPAVKDIYPLSPTQQGMLFHSLYGPDSGAYVVQVGFTVKGALDLEAFSQAWRWLVQRHGVLRTAFVWDSLEAPLQVVGQRAELHIALEDWQTQPDPQQALADWLAGDRRRGFDLSAAPLMRVTAFKLATDTHRIIWTYHHLLLDGWSVPLLLRELLVAYQAFEQGRSPALASPRPYRDYIAWLKQQDAEVAAQFWRQRLQGLSAPTPLGIDRPPTAPSSSHYTVCQRSLSPALSQALRSHAQSARLTLNTLVTGAWALVLGRYSGEPEVLFGSTSAGRPPSLPGAETMVGLFINTLPLRVNLAPEQTVTDWLQRLQSQQLAQQPYEYAPLVQIHGSSDISRSLPLFESVVVFENYPVEPALKQGVKAFTIDEVTTAEQTNYPLALFATAGDTLDLKAQYDDDRFTSGAIERLLGHLEMALSGIVADPQQTIGALPLLTEAEHQLIEGWNQTWQAVPECCVHELIAAQATERPEAIAVVFEDVSLSYEELDRRVSELAGHLQQQGVKPGDRVAFCLGRSLLLVVVMLAILRVGAAYVPLDPTYPAERLRFILGDAQASLLITDGGAVDLDDSVPVLNLSGSAILLGAISSSLPSNLHSATAGEPSRDSNLRTVGPLTPNPGGTREELTSSLLIDFENSDLESGSPNFGGGGGSSESSIAYLIYTSGSTGTPKGVPVRHHSLTNLLTSMAQAPGMGSSDTLLAVTTPAFDIAALELLLPLTVGGTLVIASQEATRDPQQLAQQMQQHSVTLMQATPATWRLLVESGWQGKAGLKLLCGGEALDIALARELTVRGELWNLYGPTETTIWSAAVKIEPATLEDGIVPIGRAIANTSFHVLDEQNRPVPIGAAGELHIGGAGLSPGYWRRPDLTAERFIANPSPALNLVRASGRSPLPMPISPRPTLYKTGDRVRQREDGTLEYLGRLDHQIKLRGYRIELGEIETALVQQPEVKQAVVVLRDEQLVAYSVAELPIDKLSDRLRQRLPSYMVPTCFVVLDALPLTPNGKVDRKALPQPTRPEAVALPRTQAEKAIAAIWQDVLGTEQVSLHDNFFDLGGHSLLVVRVRSQIQQQMGAEVSLVDLFRYPTVNSLAAQVRSLASPGSHPDDPQDTDRTLALAAGKQRLQQRRQRRKGGSHG